MCVVALALNAHPKWRIILAGNRDELHARPSAALARWEGIDSPIIAGRDLVSGGTWLGASETGRLAVVTNIRTGALPDPDKLSRGDLVANYLGGNGTPLVTELDRYNAFSLLCIGPEGAELLANRPTAIRRKVPDGIHGLSNGLPDEPWPRKSHLLNTVKATFRAGDTLGAALLDMLSQQDGPDGLFIQDEIYGTRCSTVVLVDHHGAATIIERSFDMNGTITGQNKHCFKFT